jgi:transketolase
MRADGPTALVLSRQALPHQPRSPEQVAGIRRGGYVLREPDKPPAAIIIATGSEVALARTAAAALAADGIPVRVVSMPCVEAFERQDGGWRRTVLPPHLPAIAVEAGATRGWWRYAGRSGAVIGLDQFGESAPEKDLFRHFGFTPERVMETVRSVIARRSSCPIR